MSEYTEEQELIWLMRQQLRSLIQNRPQNEAKYRTRLMASMLAECDAYHAKYVNQEAARRTATKGRIDIRALMGRINRLTKDHPSGYPGLNSYRDFEGLVDGSKTLVVCIRPDIPNIYVWDQVMGEDEAHEWPDKELVTELRDALRTITLNLIHEQMDQYDQTFEDYNDVYELCYYVYQVLTVAFWTRATDEQIKALERPNIAMADINADKHRETDA